MGALLAMLSGAGYAPDRFIFGYAILLTGHLSVHYSNDYFDAEADSFGQPSVTSGGSGILVTNPELRPISKWLE